VVFKSFFGYRLQILLHSSFPIFPLSEAFSTQVRGFKLGRSRRIIKGEKILSTPSFGGEVKPSVPCRRFAACKKIPKKLGSRHFGKIYRTTFSPTVPTSAARIPHVVADVEAPGGEKWEHQKAGESNGKLRLRTCPGCSVAEPYQSPN